ncbi:hypothetical protein [Kribbella sp. NPDC049584]|uniref:hypothetical protein n=1 Tax=Kribbella sp. NPDC049584 TaxID=3154833 RepID=UPI0034207B09
MARSRQRKHETAFAVVVTAIAAAAYSIYSIDQHDWSSALWTGSVAVAVPCWLIALKAPTSCGVTTRTGRRCPNPSNGVLFGCGNAEGHTWAKFFGHFGWRRKSAQPNPPGRTASARPDPQLRQEGKSARRPHDVRDSVLFWAAIIATLAGLVSAATDLAGIFQQ